MEEELVTVAEFPQVLEAEAAKIFLEDNGIPAFVADENAAAMLWPNLVGPKLQVAAADGERAKKLLAKRLH
jgi:hypothetical protein